MLNSTLLHIAILHAVASRFYMIRTVEKQFCQGLWSFFYLAWLCVLCFICINFFCNLIAHEFFKVHILFLLSEPLVSKVCLLKILHIVVLFYVKFAICTLGTSWCTGRKGEHFESHSICYCVKCQSLFS